MTRIQRRTLWISIAGVLAVVAYAVLAALQILVLNPLAAAPGLTLEEIRFEMAEAGENLGQGAVFSVLGIGVALAVVTAVVCVVGRAHPIVPALSFLALLTGGVVAYFVASFGAGMALADTFMIGGADYSPWARPLYVVSALAGLTVIAVSLAVARSRHPAQP